MDDGTVIVTQTTPHPDRPMPYEKERGIEANKDLIENAKKTLPTKIAHTGKKRKMA